MSSGEQLRVESSHRQNHLSAPPFFEKMPFHNEGFLAGGSLHLRIRLILD